MVMTMDCTNDRASLGVAVTNEMSDRCTLRRALDDALGISRCDHQRGTGRKRRQTE